jgi:acyl-CoA hydrolase
MADHTAGGAARSVSGDKDVLTVEFKINYLRPAIGDRLRCTANVLRAGKTVIVAEALVYTSHGGKEALVAKLTETLFLTDDPKARAEGVEWDSMLTRTRAKGKALDVSSEADVERRSDEYRRDKKR